MLSQAQTEQTLRALIEPLALAGLTAVVDDRTGLLTAAIGGGLEVAVAGQTWLAWPWGGPVDSGAQFERASLLELRRRLWERRPGRLALVVAPGEQLGGLRDITHGARRLAAGGSALLRVLARVELPDDERLDGLAGVLLSAPGLGRLLDRQVTRANLGAAVLTALLDKEFMATSGGPELLAQVLRCRQPLPEAAFGLAQEFAEGIGEPFGGVVGALLSFGRDAGQVAVALLEAQLSMSAGQLPDDALVSQFLKHAATAKGSHELKQLAQYAQCIEKALFADPGQGREIARRLRARRPAPESPILAGWLEADILRQSSELLAGKRTAIDDRAWRAHLFYEEYRSWAAAATRIAFLLQLRDEVLGLAGQGLQCEALARIYADRIAAGDLAWMELGELSKRVVALSKEIAEAKERYRQARDELNRVFARQYSQEYPHVFGRGDLPMVAHLVRREVKPRLEQGERVLLLIVDGLGCHLWQRFRADLIAKGWEVKDGQALALLPTLTAVSRFAIFAGPQRERLYTELYEPEDAEVSEDEQCALHAQLPGTTLVVHRKAELRDRLTMVTADIHGEEYDLVVVVVNEVDEAIRTAADAPFPLTLEEYPMLSAVLEAAKQSNRVVLITADHGFSPDTGHKWQLPTGAAPVEARLARASEEADSSIPAVLCRELIYNLGGPLLALHGMGGRFSALPKVGYHSGIGLEEVVVPAAWVRPGSMIGVALVRFVALPERVTEDEELSVAVEVRQPAWSGQGELRLEVWLPGLEAVSMSLGEQPGIAVWRREVAWKPELPGKEPVEARTVQLRAKVYREGLEIGDCAAQVVVTPRRGKYESAAAALLP